MLSFSQKSVELWIKEGSDLYGTEIVRDIAEKLKVRLEEKIHAVKEISNELAKAMYNRRPRKQSENRPTFNLLQVRLFENAVQQKLK